MKNDKRPIVVMGGSFNPPTIAHYRLMKGSVEQWRGENLLGCALMEVRDWLNNK